MKPAKDLPDHVPPHASPHAENHCISHDGVDLNLLYGISEQIVTRFCTQVDAGEQWTAPGPPWCMSFRFDSVPEGFEPAGATPLDDFVAKFVGVKYVIDPGTPQEETVDFPTSDRLWTGTLAEYQAVSGATLSIYHPLSVGDHAVQVFWQMRAQHCDGLGNEEGNILPAGEFQWTKPSFKVNPRDH